MHKPTYKHTNICMHTFVMFYVCICTCLDSAHQGRLAGILSVCLSVCLFVGRSVCLTHDFEDVEDVDDHDSFVCLRIGGDLKAQSAVDNLLDSKFTVCLPVYLSCLVLS